MTLKSSCDGAMFHCDNWISPNIVLIMFDFKESFIIFAKITIRCWFVVD